MIKRFLLLLLLLQSVLSPAQNWTSLPDFPGSARDDASGFILGNNFYAGTGLDGGFNATRDFYVFDLVNETWSTGTSLPIGMERQYASGFSVGNAGYIFGGIGPGSTYLNDLWKFDPGTSTWTSLTPMPASGRRGTSVFVIGNEVYFTGGHNATQGTLNDTWKYNTLTDTWTSTGTFPFSSFWRGSGCAINGTGYLLSGIDSANHYIEEMYSYNPTTNTWTLFQQMPAIARGYCPLLAIGNELCFYGGYNPGQGYFNDLFRYDLQLNAFVPYSGPPALGRRGFVAGVWNNTIYITTGLLSTPARTTETWKVNGIVSLTEPENPSSKIYPNPFAEYLQLPENGELEIIDLAGRKIINTSVVAGKFNTSFLQKGMYLIRFTNDQSMVKTELFFCSGTE
jgi:N-acetylneuraminic acid mutarotase